MSITKDRDYNSGETDSKHDSKYSNYCIDSTTACIEESNACSQLSTLSGCGKCTYQLSDINFLSLLDDISIKHIFEELMQQCILFPTARILLGKSVITCDGDISIKYKLYNNYSNIKHNRTICFRIIDEWLRINTDRIHKVINILYLIVCAAILYYDDNQQRACKILGNLESINSFIQQYSKDITS